MKEITVVAAILIKNKKILCMQRGDSNHEYISRKFEFPGGKVENGEENHDALKRELREEMDLDLEISPDQFYMTVEHSYPDFRVIMHSFLLKDCIGEFTLNEHIGYQWLDKEKLDSLDWALADLPIVEKLMKENLDE